MIELVILSITEKPTKETAPLFVKLNNSFSRATQGIGVGQQVTLCDSRKDAAGVDIEMPYVRIYDDGQSQPQDRAIKNNGGEVQNEMRLMVVECAAQGSTKYEAAYRAEKLRMVSMAVLRSLINEIDDADLTLGDDGGSSSYYSINNWVVSPADDPHTKADGTTQLEPEDNTFTSMKYINVEVWLTLQLA